MAEFAQVVSSSPEGFAFAARSLHNSRRFNLRWPLTEHFVDSLSGATLEVGIRSITVASHPPLPEHGCFKGRPQATPKSPAIIDGTSLETQSQVRLALRKTITIAMRET